MSRAGRVELGNHVTGAADGGEREASRVGSLPATNLLTVVTVVVHPAGPIAVGGAEVHLLGDPLGGTSPRDNRISVTRVDQDANVVLEELVVVGEHAGTRLAVLQRVTANRPLNAAIDVESGRSIRAVQVVLGVVGINARHLRGAEEGNTVDGILRREHRRQMLLRHLGARTIIARTINPVGVNVVVSVVRGVEQDAARETIGIRTASRLNVGIHAGAHQTMTVGERHPSIEGRLRLGVGDGVTRTSTDEVDLGVATLLVAVDDRGSQSRHVDTSITLTENVEGQGSILGGIFEEGDQEGQVVSGGRSISGIVVAIVVGVGVSDTNRALEVDDAGILGPSVGIVDQGDVLSTGTELVRTVLVEETIERRATRTTVEPEDHRIGRRVSGRRNENVVVVLLGTRQVYVTRIHLNEFRRQVRKAMNAISRWLSNSTCCDHGQQGKKQVYTSHIESRLIWQSSLGMLLTLGNIVGQSFWSLVESIFCLVRICDAKFLFEMKTWSVISMKHLLSIKSA